MLTGLDVKQVATAQKNGSRTELTQEVDTIGSQKGTELKAELRRAESLELYLGGHSFRQVGEKLGVSHQTASKDVHKRLGQLVDADIAEGLALRSLQAARYQRLLRTVWDEAIAGGEKAYAQALQVLHKLDSLFGLVKLAEMNLNVDARSINGVGDFPWSQLAREAETDTRQVLLDQVGELSDHRAALSNDQLADILDVKTNGPRPLFRVVYDPDGSENGDSPPALPEPEGQQLEAAPVESTQEPEGHVEEAEPIERTSRRREADSRQADEEIETVTQRHNKNLLAFLAADDGLGA